MSGEMLRTSERCLAYRTLVIPGHGCSQLLTVAVPSAVQFQLHGPSPWEK